MNLVGHLGMKDIKKDTSIKCQMIALKHLQSSG